MTRSYTIAVVGATGAVGRMTLAILAERRFPVARLLAFASSRSEGKTLTFCGESLPLRVLRPGCFVGVDFAFFAAGGATSRQFVPQAVAEGAVVIDKSSVYRFDPEVPLVVPEVNPQALKAHRGLIANPNCSTKIGRAHV